MKKIILIITVFFILLQLSNEILASLQQELTVLSDNLIVLEKVLNESKINKRLEQNFVQLLGQAQELVSIQKESFNKIVYFLKGVDSTKPIVSIYAGIKRNFEKTLGVANDLRELVTKIYLLQDEPLVLNKFDREIVDLYKKIKNDWQMYTNEFHAFFEKNKNEKFFNKVVYIDTVGDFSLKPFVKDIDASISENNRTLQGVVSEYIEELKARKTLLRS